MKPKVNWLIIVGLSVGLLVINCAEDNDNPGIPVNHPPNMPSNPLPANGATGVGGDTNLSWTCSDPENDSLLYNIFFGTEPNPPLLWRNITATNCDPRGGNLGFDTYYWIIVVRDDKGNQTEGPLWQFRIN